jgi:hypothetical protein
VAENYEERDCTVFCCWKFHHIPIGPLRFTKRNRFTLTSFSKLFCLTVYHKYTQSAEVESSRLQIMSHLSEYQPRVLPSLFPILMYLFIARMEEGRCALKNLTGKPTGKRPLGRPRRRWEGDIRMNLEGIGINAGNGIDSAQDRDYWRALVNAALSLRVP